METHNDPRTFGALIPECLARGISRSVTYELLADGMLDTFKIGRKRYVYLDSLATLPERLAERDKGEAA